MSDKQIGDLVPRDSKLGFSYRSKPSFREQKFEKTELKKENEELHSESIYSTVVSGMYNKKGFDEIVIPEVSGSLRDHHNHYVAFIDADGLKAINDSLGHDTGSKMLDTLGQAIKGEFKREDDIACHIFGTAGDEFLLSSKDINLETFIEKLKATRDRFENQTATKFGGVQPSFSFGVAKIGEFIIGGYDKDKIKSDDIKIGLHKEERLDPNVALEDTVNVAEIRMYKDKKARKQGRI